MNLFLLSTVTVTSKNCTEQDNSQCKIIVDEGESLTLCSSVDTHGRESFINSSSWIFTTKSATFNASLCTSYDSSECRNLYRRRMLVVQKEWGSCLVLKNISEELDGTRVKYRMIPAFQAKVNSILESREMTINVLTGTYVFWQVCLCADWYICVRLVYCCTYVSVVFCNHQLRTVHISCVLYVQYVYPSILNYVQSQCDRINLSQPPNIL